MFRLRRKNFFRAIQFNIFVNPYSPEVGRYTMHRLSHMKRAQRSELGRIEGGILYHFSQGSNGLRDLKSIFRQIEQSMNQQ